MTSPTFPEENLEIRAAVRQRYGRLAEQAETGAVSCADTGGCCGAAADEVVPLDSVVAIYEDPNAAGLPAEVTGLSLGCGDPVTLASLKPGQTVLDLGSGGGIDCFLAAKKVGPAGRVIGVDMTPQMIERARANRVKVGADNVEFRLGEIEHLPVESGTVDVILSNCVINLSPDKVQVFGEAFRVLKPGGRLAISDIVTDGPLPAAVKNSLSAWAGCVAGALDAQDYLAGLAAAGFVDIELVPEYWDQEMIDEAVSQLDPEAVAQVAERNKAPAGEQVDWRRAVFSAKISARRPA